MGQSPTRVAEAVEGKTREESWPDLYLHIRAVAHQGSRAMVLASTTEPTGWMGGTVAELGKTTLVVVDGKGMRTALPRWLAGAVHRDQLGDCLTIAHDRLDEGQMLVDALPGLPSAPAARRSPYGRHDSLRRISKADAARLGGRPAPLRVLVPVTIDR